MESIDESLASRLKFDLHDRSGRQNCELLPAVNQGRFRVVKPPSPAKGTWRNARLPNVGGYAPFQPHVPRNRAWAQKDANKWRKS